jgi:hypothetical protein
VSASGPAGVTLNASAPKSPAPRVPYTFRIVLKVKGIEDVHDRRRLFRIEQDGQPAPDSDLRMVAIYARRLLAENDLLGDCRAAPGGSLLLDLPDMEKTYFYDGIVFAALDAFNNPNKNPTITGLPPIE